MRPLFALFMLVSLGRESVAVEGIPDAELEFIIQKHESYIAKLISAKVNWSIHDASNVESEAGELLMSPMCELLAFGTGKTDRQFIRWDDKYLQWMVGFDIETVKNDPTAIEAVRAFRYAQDMPIKRLFNWRSLRAYRLLASDSDLNLRQICGCSTTPPVVTDQEGILAIRLTHPGALQPNGELQYAGSSVEVFLDPKLDYAVSRYVSVVRMKNNPEGALTQDMRVEVMGEYDGGIRLPTKVWFVSKSGTKTAKQEIRFDYSFVNEPIEIPASVYAENVLVQDYPRYESTEPTGFFVAGKNGDLGEQIRGEVDATKVRYDRLAKIVTVPPSRGFPYFIGAFFVIAAVSLSLFIWNKRKSSR